MKIRIIWLAALLAVSATFILRAEDHKKQPQEEETELEGKMDKMGGAFRKLKRQVADATKNADSLQLVATMQVAAAEAIELIPAKAADVPAADRPKFLADYRAAMKKLAAELGMLEAALKAGKNEEAAKLVAEIGALQKAGHREFKRPDEQ